MFRLEGSEFSIVQFGRNPTKVVIDSKQVCAKTLADSKEVFLPSCHGFDLSQVTKGYYKALFNIVPFFQVRLSNYPLLAKQAF